MKMWPLTAPVRCGHNGVRELKTRLGRYLREVRRGRTIVVTDRGEPVAELRPVSISAAGSAGELERLVALGHLTRPAKVARGFPRHSRQWPSGVRDDRRRARRSRVIVYVDASALVKRYVDEAGSPTVRAVVAREVIATSRLSEIEIASGLVRRFREAGISSRNLERTVSSLREDIRSIAVVELDEEVTRAAVSLRARHRLRASDAVQLASCLQLRRLASAEVRLLAYHNRLIDAARAEGLAVVG